MVQKNKLKVNPNKLMNSGSVNGYQIPNIANYDNKPTLIA